MESDFILHFFKDTLFNTLSITILVMIMLLLVEFVNTSSSGKIKTGLRDKPFLQIIAAALLGLIPGCIGGFAIVSLFTHKLLSFGALVAGMITGFGDEAFVLFAISPQWTFMLIACLLPIGIMAGFITYLFSKKREFVNLGNTVKLRRECATHDYHGEKANLSIRNLKNVSPQRIVLVFGLALYLFFLISGSFNHKHAALPNITGIGIEEHNGEKCACGHDVHSLNPDTCDCHHKSKPSCRCDHNHADQGHGVWSWENIIFMLLATVTLVIVAFSSEHFLASHLWEHVIKRHFLSIFAWTLGILLFLHLFLHFVDINAIVANRQWAMLVILALALLIGIIPESGPHLIFVVLFFNGTIPFSILLANSIVQDGHGALPLLAESRKNFFLMKGVNMLVGLIVGLAGYLLHF